MKALQNRKVTHSLAPKPSGFIELRTSNLSIVGDLSSANLGHREGVEQDGGKTEGPLPVSPSRRRGLSFLHMFIIFAHVYFLNANSFIEYYFRSEEL